MNGVLAILAVGNLLLWANRCTPAGDRSFDFETFREQALETFPDSDLVGVPFPPDSMLPDEYLYLEGSGQDPWCSVYVGYYPDQELTGQQPHDPRACYRVADFTILQQDVLQLSPPEADVSVFLNRLLVEHQSEPDADGTVQVSQRTAYYWRHPRGELPTQSPGSLPSLGQLSDRLVSRRSDLVWVRVEFLLEETPVQGLPPDLAREDSSRIYRLMQAAAACMR